MGSKKTINLAVPAELLGQFNDLCKQYGHGKQKGMVLSAAILMFLRADPAEQGNWLHEIATAEIDAGVKRMMARGKGPQGLRIAESGPRDRPTKRAEQPAKSRPTKAAKRAGKAKRGVTKLPKLDDFR